MATRKLKTKKIVVIGVGSAGGNAVNRIGRSVLGGPRFVALGSDSRNLKMYGNGIEKVLIGNKLFHGEGANGDLKAGMKAARSDIGRISSMLAGNDGAIIVAGLGGGTGTTASKVIAEEAERLGIPIKAVLIYPFHLEKKRMVRADAWLGKIARHCDSVLIESNDWLVRKHPDMPAHEAFALMDSKIARQVMMWVG